MLQILVVDDIVEHESEVAARAGLDVLYEKERQRDERQNANQPSLPVTSNSPEWSVDPEAAILCQPAGNEGECPLGHIEQSRTWDAVGIADKLVQTHPRAARKIEQRSVSKCNADASIGSGLDNVTARKWVPGSGLHRHAIASDNRD